MQVLDLDGDSFERGYQQGVRLKERYDEMIDVFFTSELWRENKPWGIPRFIVDIGLSAAGSVITKPAVKRHLPRQYDRVKGIAKGLGINRGLAWGIQFMELMLCEAGSSLVAPVSGGCTQVHAQPHATADGRPLSGRNYDFPNLLAPYQVVRRDIPAEKGRLATTTVTQIPVAGAHQGINESGLAIAANNARLWRGEDLRLRGVPYELLLVEILETCTSTAEAVGYITKFPARANAGFFGMMDSSGDCRIVEFTASRYSVRKPDESGVIAQSNHYHALKSANLPDGTTWNVKGMLGLEYATSTKSRFQAADKLMRQAAGGIDVKTIQSVLRDHSANGGIGNDNTVCCHGDSGSTLASMVVDVRDRTMWVAEGAPCESEYMKVDFRDRK